ncbi:MAG: N-6 DNA methylase [candidate division NC10 bacterium]|nr:N-6 DNA methylase [candidate division NC10 bacterium]
MNLKARSKANVEFLTKVMSVFEAFEYQGKKYLAYLAHRDAGDEFHIRSTLIVPLFQILGYDPAKNIYHEVTCQAGDVDLLIRDDRGRNLILVETKSSTVENLLPHRPQLWKYLDELTPKFAVLTNGVRFEWFEYKGKGKAIGLGQVVDLKLTYERFFKRGIEGLTNDDWEDIVKLRYLSKEYHSIQEEDLYQDPELDVSQEAHFITLLEDLKDCMEYVKGDIAARFEEFQAQYEEFARLQQQLQEGKAKLWQLKGFESAKTWHQAYTTWQSIASSNGKTSENFVTETMYILFNRILLIRICEDKKITPRHISNGGIKRWLEWRGFAQKARINYSELLKSTYEVMDAFYPHLFQRDLFDWYVPDSEVALKLLFTFNRYNCAKVDRDILGKLYEQYIDREERKRLGQFYTPEEVVDYILEAVGYTPDHEIEGKLLLDPACGSGGFLVRAVKALVERYRRKGVDPETILKKIQDSIYGFDINPFAAHLAEMNLLFQVIDLITEAKGQNAEFRMEKFNIFQTNSLKLPETAGSGPQMPLLGETTGEFLEGAETVKKIKLKQGPFAQGFDFVVGNPPYVRQEKLKAVKEDLQKHYECYHGVADLYVYFYELGLRLLSDGGRLGFISSNKFFRAGYGVKLRSLLGQKNTLEVVIDFGDLPLFEATTYPCILIMRKGPPEADHHVRALTVKGKSPLPPFAKGGVGGIGDVLDRLGKYVEEQAQLLSQSIFSPEGWHLEPPKLQKLLEKIQAAGMPLGEYVQGKFYRGIVTGLNEAFVIDQTTRDRLIAEDPNSAEIIKPFLRGRDIKRWRVDYQNLYLIFTRRGIDIERYPAIKRHLEQYKERLIPGSGRKPGNYQWSEIQDTIDYYAEFEKPKIVYPDIADKCEFAFDDQNYFVDCTVFLIPVDDLYLLALLNSSLIEFYYRRQLSPEIRGGFMRFKTIYMEQLPIVSAPPEVHQEIAKLVDEMLAIHRKLPGLEALVRGFSRFVREQAIPTQDLADCAGIILHIVKPIGKPSIQVKGTNVFLDRTNFIQCPSEIVAGYLKLFLESLGPELRGKTAKDLIGLIHLPKPLEYCAEVLQKRQALLQEIEAMKHRIEELDHEIDGLVYELYGLTDEEIRMVEEGLRR